MAKWVSKVTSKLLLATTNPGKIAEFQAMLDIPGLKLLELSKVFNQVPEIEETGNTFRDNALIKARGYALLSNLSTVADDSGLEVLALDNKPGVISARYAEGSDKDRCLKLLKELKDDPDRRARFITTVCYFDPLNSERYFFNGTLNGKIATQILGNNGFGYDSVFIPAGFDMTLAQLGSIVKNQISHRHQAMIKLKEFLVARL